MDKNDKYNTPFERGKRAGESSGGNMAYIYGSIYGFVSGDHTIEEVREYLDGIELGVGKHSTRRNERRI